VPEHPGKTYGGTVEASAQAVDPSSGTTLMQIIVDNSSGELMPGGYASIHLQIDGTPNVLSVPSSALIFNAKGLSIATVDSGNRVRIKPVTVDRDLGAVIELASGLSPEDHVIQNPPDGIREDDAVNVAQPSASAAKSGSAHDKG
jgi:multidrug efflux pump subunit AcrA (membrane-fusion protein)